jgi:antitoxin ParD1/3/4
MEGMTMTNIEKLSIALTPEMAAVVREYVQNDEYVSSSEIIREALRDWKIKRQIQQHELEILRTQWQEGLDSGVGKLTDMDEIKAEAKKRLNAKAEHGA